MKKIFIICTGILLSFQGFSQSWSLTGNAGTNPSTNFLGTTDTERLVFRTGNVERATILSSGFMGIGISTPQSPLHVFSNTPDTHLNISGTDPSVRFFQGSVSSAVTFGRIGYAAASGAFVSSSKAGDFIVQNLDTASSLIFGTNRVSGGDGAERMRINSIGYVGIATTTPSAKLDVNCVAISGQSNPSNIRFENLQSGAGTVLVIDSNGYVFKASSGQQAATTSSLATDMQSQIEELKNQVQELRALLTSKLPLTAAETSSLQAESATFLGDIYPNPANTSTTLEYSLPAKASGALLQVYSLDGKVVSSISLPANSGKSQIQLSTGQFAPGMYIYALIVNGKVLDSKKLAVVR